MTGVLKTLQEALKSESESIPRQDVIKVVSSYSLVANFILEDGNLRHNLQT